MQNKSSIKDLYSEIRKYLFYMIPEKWARINLYASIIQRDNNEETGEMFFYYFPKSIFKKNPINVYEIPAKFNIEENSYIKLANELYNLLKQLRHECIKYDKINWSNITISIENVDFLVEYNCDNLITSEYSNKDRRLIWEYKYLDYPMEKIKKEQREIINKYLAEEERGMHKIIIYSETFYQDHIHNNIQYDINKKTEEVKYIKEDDFIMLPNEANTEYIYNDYTSDTREKSLIIKNRKRNKKEMEYIDDDENTIEVKNQILRY